MVTESSNRRTILVTGAAGYLGSVLRKALDGAKGPYIVRLSDAASLAEPPYPGETFFKANLASPDALKPIVRGVDTIIHLGGRSVESVWGDILHDNIIGTYNLFEAARSEGVRRFIYASSHHVVGFYRRTNIIGVDDPPRPDSRYAVSKVFGEALGRLYADKYGLEVLCLRLGIVRPKPPNVRSLSAWLSEPDFVRLCLSALSVAHIHYSIVYGVSANRTSFWSNITADDIGFAPVDDAFEALTSIERVQLSDDASDIERVFQGGWFCGMEFGSDPARID